MVPVALDLGDDPIARLEENIGAVVQYFGPDSREVIRKAMEQDKMNEKTLSQMDAALQKLGDFNASRRIANHVKKVSEYSLGQALPMRQYICEIAELLGELEDREVQTDPACLTEIMINIRNNSDHALRIAEEGKNKFETLFNELQGIQQDYDDKRKNAEKEAQEHGQMAIKHAEVARQKMNYTVGNFTVSGVCATVPAAKTGVIAVAVTTGAQAVAAIPLVGPALTTAITTTAAAPGFAGWVGATVTTTTVAFNPVGIMIGAALALGFGLLSAKTYLDAKQSSHDRQRELEYQDTAEKNQTKFKDLALQATDMQQLAKKMVDQSESHEKMWRGVCLSAEQAGRTFQAMENTDPNGSRARRFQAKMAKYKEDLVNFVQALDEYLYFLSKTNYFPGNYDLRKAIGHKRYDEIERQFQQATAAATADPVPALTN